MTLIKSRHCSVIKKGLSLLIILSTFLTGTLTFADTYVKPEDLGSTYDLTHYSKAFVLTDVENNYNLFAYNISQTHGIASLTKLMTLSIVLDEIDAGHLHMDDMVMISPHALSQDGNGLKLHVGDSVSVDDLIHGMLICSSNDAAVALAEHISGSEPAFVERMNQKAKDLNLNSVSFINASGLTAYDEDDNPLPDQNKMSIKDLLLLSQRLLETHPELLEITDTESWTLDSKQVVKKNTNALLETIPEVNGFKTGFTYYAGYCQITTASIDFGKANTDVIDDLTHQFNAVSPQKDMIAIVLGASSKYRKNNISSTLIQYVKNECSLYGLTNENTPIYSNTIALPLNYGLFPSETVSIAYPSSSNIQYSIVYIPYWARSPQFTSRLPVGKIVFYDDHQYLLSVDLIIKELSHY